MSSMEGKDAMDQATQVDGGMPLSRDDVRIAIRKTATRIVLNRGRLTQATLPEETEKTLLSETRGALAGDEIHRIVALTIEDMIQKGEIETGGPDEEWVMNAPR